MEWPRFAPCRSACTCSLPEPPGDRQRISKLDRARWAPLPYSALVSTCLACQLTCYLARDYGDGQRGLAGGNSLKGNRLRRQHAKHVQLIN